MPLPSAFEIRMGLLRLSLSAKVFLAALALCAFAVLGMAWASYLSFSRDFLGYLNGQAEQRLDALVPRFEHAYAEHGSWNFLLNQHPPEAWIQLLRPELPPNTTTRPSPPVSDLTGAFLRFSLLDAEHHYLIGFRDLPPVPLLRAIHWQGQVVGWLALTPFEAVISDGDRRFQQSQIRSSLVIAFVCLLLAAALAWWIARTLLRPIRTVAAATHRLAAGDYGIQLPIRSADEAGQLAQDFNRLASVLASNELQRRAFMADISHELRTPLAVLRGELEAMEDGIRPLDVGGLKSLQTEVGSLNKLVDDLFELSLAEVGGPTYRHEPLDLATLLALTADAWRPRYRQAGLELRLELPDAPLMIRGDEARLGQLFYNLLENSLRYTEAPGQVHLAARQVGNRLQVDLQDSAPGVPTTDRERLFERFYRVEGSRSRRSGGAGLGLAICRGIAEVHGGRLLAHASPLGGLWLELQLPALIDRSPA